MDIALNTDFLGGTGDPARRLKAMAEAGFTHLHWCHQWNTDFLYSASEIKQYRKYLSEYGLLLLDIHGSDGREKCWYSPVEYQRKAGVELVANRVLMMHELGGCGSLMMHIPPHRSSVSEEENKVYDPHMEALKRSLDELMCLLERYGVRIAVENTRNDTFERIRTLLEEYPEKYLGITYDSGHGNIDHCKGLGYIEKYASRLQALHLNDNDRSGDLHQPPFMGDVDWDRMAKIIAGSSYKGRPMSFELAMRNTPFFDKELELEQKEENIRSFLSDTYERCSKVCAMVEKYRSEQN